MAKQAAALCLALACFIGCSAASAQRGDRVIVTFSDSLTDTGNFFNLIANRRAPTPGVYFDGRATNAPGTWADQLPMINQQVDVENFAFFGALACKFPGLPSPVNLIPALSEQIGLFQQKLQTDKDFQRRVAGKELIPTIWIGHNDLQLLDGLPADQAKQLPGQVVQCIINGTASLLAAGHKTVVVGTLAPVDLTPKLILAAQAAASNSSSNTTAASILAGLKAVVEGINEGIRAGVKELQAKYKDSEVIVWDTDAFLRGAITNFQKFGFKFGGTSSCVVGGDSLAAIPPNSVCRDPNEFVFFDHFHPTAKAHLLVARNFLELAIANNLVSKPSYQTPPSYPSYQPAPQPSYQGPSSYPEHYPPSYQQPPHTYTPEPHSDDNGNYGGNTYNGGNGNYGGVLPAWGQCGGKSGLCMNGPYQCVDKPWDGYVCPSGQFCQRQTEWYYQCLPGGQGYQQPTYQQPTYRSDNGNNQPQYNNAPSYTYNYNGPQQAPSYSDFQVKGQSYQPIKGQMPRKALQV